MKQLFISRRSLLSHPLASFGKVSLWVGLFLFFLGIVLFLFISVIGGSSEGGFIALLVTSLQGVVWGIIGLVFSFISGANDKKLRILKQLGKCFDAEIINLVPVTGINVGLHTPTVYAECIYINEQQQRCKVRSAMFLWENFKHDGLQAKVYVDWNNPHHYAVEITQKENTQSQIDIDYT